MVVLEFEAVAAVVVVFEVGSEAVEPSVDMVVVIVGEMAVAAVAVVEIEFFAVLYIVFLVAAVVALLRHHWFACDSMLDNLRSSDSHDTQGTES